jgi:hypothetical protein
MEGWRDRILGKERGRGYWKRTSLRRQRGLGTAATSGDLAGDGKKGKSVSAGGAASIRGAAR